MICHDLKLGLFDPLLGKLSQGLAQKLCLSHQLPRKSSQKPHRHSRNLSRQDREVQICFGFALVS